MVYVFVTGDVKVTSPITEEGSTNQILRRIWFTIEDQMDNIYNNSIESFSDIKIFT